MDNKSETCQSFSGYFLWKPAAWLSVTGEDAATFLQGQFTNDLRSVGTEEAVYGLWLTVKGRVLADSFVLRRADGGFWIGSYFSSGQSIRERLEAFVIADDVIVEDLTPGWHAVTTFGEAADGIMRSLGPDAHSFEGRRAKQSHTEWVFPVAMLEQVKAHLISGREMDVREMEQMRIADGIPAVPADIGAGELPQEGALETAAISYTKGCYLGQEVMARLKSMGQVRRQLLRVRGTGPVPALPAEVHQGGRRIGEMKTVVELPQGFMGLALLSTLHLQGGAGLGWGTGANDLVLDEPA